MKDQYREWCASNKEVNIFMQPWFLDIVAPDWDVRLSFNKNDNIQGVWPFKVQKKRGFSMIQMPPYTQLLGPTVIYPEHLTTNYKKTSFYFKIVQDLERQLPRYDHLNINYVSNGGNWFPLYALGYKQSTRYSYWIDRNTTVDNLLGNLKPQLRNSLTQPCGLGEVKESNDIEGFIDLLEETFEAKGIQKFFNRNTIKSLVESAMHRKQGRIYTFKTMHAAIFVINDGNTSYLLFTASNAKGRASEGVSHLIWKAMNESLVKGRDFDFEGSMLLGVEKYFRSFGGIQKPYHQISKTNSALLKVYKFLKT